MADLIQSYLEEVRTTLTPSLEPDELTTVLLETEQHLRERVTALRELGVSEEGAESEAAGAFGPAGTYAVAMRDTYDATPKALDRPVTAGALALGLVYAVGCCAATFLVSALTVWPAIFVLFGAGGAVTLAVGAASFRSRRFVPLTLTWTSLLGGFATWVAMSCVYLNLGLTGGSGYVARYEISHLSAAWVQPETAHFYFGDVRAVQDALDAGVDFQLLGNADYFWNSTALLFLLLFTANLIGAGFGNAMRQRRLRRMTRV